MSASGFYKENGKTKPITPVKGINKSDFGHIDPFRKDLIKVENYKLVAENGRPIRTATKVIIGKTKEVKFMDRLSKDEAIVQAFHQLQKEGNFADEHRIKKEFGFWKSEYGKVHAPLQSLRRIFEENGLIEEAEQTEKLMRILSHQFHKSEYPERYVGDKQAD